MKERDDYKNKISNAQNDYKKLGLFQGKQKKELRLQIEKYETHLNELSSVISEIEGVIEIEKAPLLKKNLRLLAELQKSMKNFQKNAEKFLLWIPTKRILQWKMESSPLQQTNSMIVFHNRFNSLLN